MKINLNNVMKRIKKTIHSDLTMYKTEYITSSEYINELATFYIQKALYMNIKEVDKKTYKHIHSIIRTYTRGYIDKLINTK